MHWKLFIKGDNACSFVFITSLKDKTLGFNEIWRTMVATLINNQHWGSNMISGFTSIHWYYTRIRLWARTSKRFWVRTPLMIIHFFVSLGITYEFLHRMKLLVKAKNISLAENLRLFLEKRLNTWKIEGWGVKFSHAWHHEPKGSLNWYYIDK